MYTLGDIPYRCTKLFPNNIATVFEGVRLTYQELNDRVNRLANAFLNMGYKKGDRVAILGENSHKYLEVYFAAGKMGAVVVPLNFRLSDPELVHIVNDSEASLFLAGDGYEDRSIRLSGECKNINNWISLDKESDGFEFYESLLGRSSSKEPEVIIDENDMANLMYTGGTTGLPKGVMLSHRNIMTSTIAIALQLGLTTRDATCFVLPLFHIAYWPAMAVLLVGGKVAITRRPELLDILKLIQDEKCTHINMVPTLYGWLVNLPQLDEFDLSSLRLMTYAGSPCPPEVLKKCIEKFGNICGQAYGMTEASPLVSILMPDDHVLEGSKSKLLLSAGRGSLCTEVRVVNEEDAPVEPGEIGEIAIRGKNIMMGYWKKPELTSQALRNGWYHSGDMGRMDEEGYLYLVDRKSDMIVTGGENVYPKEVEDILYEHSAVQECAVVSAPDERWGERVQAVVVLRNGHSAKEEELIGHCKSKLAGYKCPKNVLFWDSLPKTPVGKIIRRDVKSHFWKGQERNIN